MDLKPLALTLAVSILALSGGAAFSQEKEAVPAENECDISHSEITQLREPYFGRVSSAWDLVYSEDGMDVFSDFVPLDAEHFVAVGSYTKDPKDSVYHPLLVKFDEAFKEVWTVREDTKEQKTIHRLIKEKDDFTVLGDLTDASRGNGIYIGAYDSNGKAKGEIIRLFEKGGDLDAKAFVPSQDGAGYIIAAQFVSSKDQEKQTGFLYKISRGGKTIWKRSFQAGNSNVFNNIQTAQDGSYIVVGQIVMDGNKSGGWLLRIYENGAIRWQRTYQRGAAASLQSVAQTKEGEFIVAGKARPGDARGEGLAAWVMKTDSTGNTLWQRYFRGPYNYEAPDMIVYEDGRASVLLNAGGMDGRHRSHTRLVTFSPSGKVLHVENYTEGQNAAAMRLVPGYNGERVMIGYSQTSFGEDQKGNEASAAPIYTYDAWLMAAVPLDTYDDPCASARVMSPILP